MGQRGYYGLVDTEGAKTRDIDPITSRMEWEGESRHLSHHQTHARTATHTDGRTHAHTHTRTCPYCTRAEHAERVHSCVASLFSVRTPPKLPRDWDVAYSPHPPFRCQSPVALLLQALQVRKASLEFDEEEDYLPAARRLRQQQQQFARERAAHRSDAPAQPASAEKPVPAPVKPVPAPAKPAPMTEPLQMPAVDCKPTVEQINAEVQQLRAGVKQNMPGLILQHLHNVAKFDLTFKLLADTELGRLVRSLRTHEDTRVRQFSQRCVILWKDIVKAYSWNVWKAQQRTARDT